MGFPTEVVLPKVFVQFLSVLGFIKKLITIFFCYLNFESDISFPEIMPEIQSVNLREILPVVKFSELAEDSCVVCLYEFKADDEIRQLTKCCHIFHMNCLDRWMGYDHTTCPLCRTSFIPYHMQDSN